MGNLKDDYAGAVEAYKKLRKLIGSESIPKDPMQVIAMAKRMKEEEDLYHRARRARQEIENIKKERKERKAYARKMRRLELEWKIHSAREKTTTILNKLRRK